jgi:Glycosyltransferase family 87
MLNRDQDLFVDAVAARAGRSARFTMATVAGCNRLFIGLCVLTLLVQTVWFSVPTGDPNPRTFADFDAFYLAAQMVWRGEFQEAYDFSMFTRAHESFFGAPRFLPWAYPPQFGLFIAPLAIVPYGAAYGLFTAATLIAYLLVLKRLAGEGFAVVSLVSSPAILVTILCGQNGFLTGTLIGLTCIAVQNRRASAGLPLGLMIIKPHLAVAYAVYMVMTRRWAVTFVSATTVAATSILTTVLLGTDVWPAFVTGAEEARTFLREGTYPVFRMISPYAALRSFGASATAAFVGQAIVAALALAMVCFLARRQLPPRQALGFTAIASLLISPYGYDYDLPILGVGLALLLPDVLRWGNRREQAAILAFSFVTGLIGLLQTFLRLKAPVESILTAGDNMALSVAGLTLLTVLGLTFRILRRSRKLDGRQHQNQP